MVTPEQRRLIRDSFPDISQLSGPIAMLFYGRLFELAPEVRVMFRQDISVQGRKLMDMLTVFVDHLDRMEELEPMLRALGQRHTAYGVTAEQYATVATALIWAFGVALEEEFPAELKAAWRTLIEAVSAVMIDGAAALSPR